MSSPDMVSRSQIVESRPRHSTNFYGLFAIAACLLIIALIAFPIGRMVVSAFYVDGHIELDRAFSILRTDWLAKVLRDTAITVVGTTICAVFTGSLLAWLNERTDANLGIVGAILPVIPLLVPGIALAIGWVFLAAPRVGFINGLLAGMPILGREGLNLSLNIYSWAGLIWVYTLNGVPPVYLVVSAALANLNPELEEASRLNGASPLRTFFRVSLPAIKPALYAAGFLTVIGSFAMFAIPTVIGTTAGIDLLPVRMVRLLRNTYPPEMGQAIALSLVMLLVVGLVWYVNRLISVGQRFVQISGKAARTARMRLGAWRLPIRATMLLFLACTSVLPLLALLVVALQPYWTPVINPAQFTLANFHAVLFENRLTRSAFTNSLFLAGTGATIGSFFAVVVAIYVNRGMGAFPRVADAILKWPAAVPNLVIALGFLVTFSGPPFNLSGTLALLLIAMIVIYIPAGSIAANSAVAQVGRELAEASAIEGANEGKTVRRIIVPLAMPGIVAGWTLMFVHMMGDLSAAALLAGLSNSVIGFAILEIWENGSFGHLAAFASLMCGVILIVVVTVVSVFGTKGFRRN